MCTVEGSAAQQPRKNSCERRVARPLAFFVVLANGLLLLMCTNPCSPDEEGIGPLRIMGRSTNAGRDAIKYFSL